MGSLRRDLRLGFRLLLRNPGFTSVAVLTLALAIAANAVVFSVVHSALLAPLHYRDPDRLVNVWIGFGGERRPCAPEDFHEWKQQARVFEALEAWRGVGRDVNLATAEQAGHVHAGMVTPGKLSMMGFGHPLALGRDFFDGEGATGRDQVAILSHRLWRERFGAEPGVIGRTVRVDGRPYTVVGVLGEGPADAFPFQLWLPRAFTPDQRDPRVGEALYVVGRLKPGVTVEQASAEVATIAGRAHPDYKGLGVSVGVEPFVGDRVSRELRLLFGAVLFVLLIACGNVANMLLARATARERELAVRVAMGASRGDIARQLVAESLLLAALGGVLGAALAHGLLKVVVALLPASMRGAESDIRLSLPVLLFTAGACAATGLLAGGAPAWQATRSSLNAVLGQAGAAVTGSGHRLRRALVVVEFALAVALLTGGLLAVRSLLVLTRADLGFRPERVLTFHLPLQEGRAKSPEQSWAFCRELLERVRALPDVRTAAVSTAQPLQIFYGIAVQIVGRPVDPARPSWAMYNLVTPDYFRTLGLRIVKGRSFDESDTRGRLPVAMVNETFVKRYLPGPDPLRERLLVSDLAHPETDEKVECRIVGVYSDARSRGTDAPHEEIALPFWQMPWPAPRVAVRTVADPFAVRRDVEAIVRSLDPVLPLADVKTLEQVVSESLDGDRFKTLLFGSFGFVALLLAALGVYGVTSFAVARRTREIGLRMALGAERRQVLRQVLRQGLADVMLGIVLGAAGAGYATRALRGILYGLESPGPAPFVVVVLTLLGAAVVACSAPALRAASVDPVEALRQE